MSSAKTRKPRAIHPPDPNSKRSRRRRAREEREAYRADREACILGAPVVGFHFLRGRALRAAFGRVGGRRPHPGTAMQRAVLAYEAAAGMGPHGAKTAERWGEAIEAEVSAAAYEAEGVAVARDKMCEVRELQAACENAGAGYVKRAEGRIERLRSEIRSILEDVGRPIPAEFRVSKKVPPEPPKKRKRRD